MATAGTADTFGWWSRAQPWVRLAPAVFALGLALVSWPNIAVESWMRVHVDTAAWLVFVAAAGIRWWATLCRASEPRGLVATGPYSICRNPMLMANLLFGVSFALFLASATFAIGFVVGAIGCLSLAVAAEEHELARRFGREYRDYCNEVPRYWLRMGHFRSPETLIARRADLIPELRLTALWMWLPIIGKMLAQFRAEAWWPHLLRLP
jgi:protein-S-isoprenylcysteine O-methyltransferase Ste14